MASKISSLVKSSHAEGALYIGLLAAILGDIIPTPADGVYFWYQNKLKNQLQNNQITAKQYWSREALAYYTLNPLWWLLIFGATASIKGNVKSKLSIALGLIGFGVVAGVIFKNIQQDKNPTRNIPGGI